MVQKITELYITKKNHNSQPEQKVIVIDKSEKSCLDS